MTCSAVIKKSRLFNLVRTNLNILFFNLSRFFSRYSRSPTSVRLSLRRRRRRPRRHRPSHCSHLQWRIYQARAPTLSR